MEVRVPVVRERQVGHVQTPGGGKDRNRTRHIHVYFIVG